MGSPVRRYWSALTSNSSNSKSATAARSSLIASGTNSLPAPSQGSTAIFLGTGLRGFPLAQLVALDLASRGLGQLGHELDEMRVLVALQVRLAVLLELGHERIAGRRLAFDDDEGLDFREPRDLDADHGAFGHRWVLHQRRLDLDRRGTEPAHLDHVVGATLVPVKALRIDAVAIASEEPFPKHRPLGLLVLGPIERERTVTLDVEVSRLPRRYGLAFVVEDLQLVTGDRLATGTRPHVVRPVGTIDVKQLGRADAVEDGQAVRLLPAPPHLPGQGLGGGDAIANRRESSVPRAFKGEDRVEQ